MLRIINKMPECDINIRGNVRAKNTTQDKKSFHNDKGVNSSRENESLNSYAPESRVSK